MSAVRTACVAALALSSCLWGAEKPKDVDPIWKRFDKGPRGFEIAILASKTTVKVNETVRLYLLVRNAGPKEWSLPRPHAVNTALYDGLHLVPDSLSPRARGGASIVAWQPGTVRMHAIAHRWSKAGRYGVQLSYGIHVETMRVAMVRGEKMTEVPADGFGGFVVAVIGGTSLRLPETPQSVSTHPIEITVTE